MNPLKIPKLVFGIGTILLFSLCLLTAQNTPNLIDISVSAGATGNSADTEPSIAINPANPLQIAAVSFTANWGPGSPAPVWWSTDRGNNWTLINQIPQPPVPATAPAGTVSVSGPGDQKIVFDNAGNFLVVELGVYRDNAFNNLGLGNFVYRQTGAFGTNLTPGAVFGWDQPHLDVDIGTTSPCFGQVYSPWLNFIPANEQSMVTNSNNNGIIMTNVGVGNNTSFANRTTRIAIDPNNGRTYVVYKIRQGSVDSRFENATFTVNRSDDCGTTWNGTGSALGTPIHAAATVVTWFTDTNSSLANGFGNFSKGQVGRARSSDAWIAVDPSDGDVYVAYTVRDASGFGQIYVARSVDGGVTWNSTRATSGNFHSAYPEIAVAANGVVGVLYVDYDDSGTNTVFRHRIARSFDDGATWNDTNVQSLNISNVGNGGNGFLWGDYEGLSASGNKFYGVFTGQSIGLATPQLNPIFFTINAGIDNKPPAVTCPASISVNNDPGDCGAIVNFTATASDDFSPDVVAVCNLPSGSLFPVGENLVNCSATDESGNSASCSFTITVLDNENPVITCPPNITVDCDTTAATGTGIATVTDNCALVSPPTYVDQHISGDCDWLCTIERTWTITDQAGNSSSCVQTIIKDTEPLIEEALSADINGDGKSDPLVLGVTFTTMTIGPESSACVLQWLPHISGTPIPLKRENGVVGPACAPGINEVDPSGKITNPLFAEVLKLELFIRLDPSIGETLIGDLGCTIAPIVLQGLRNDDQLKDLVEVANKALGNLVLTPHLSELLAALECINEPLNICDAKN